MRHTLALAAIALLAASCGGRRPAAPPSDTPRDQLMNRLMDLSREGKIAYGHQDDIVYGHSWKVDDWENDPLERSDVKDVSGSYPLVVGFDLGGIEKGDSLNLDGVPFGLIRKATLAHIGRGGIVTFSWHPDNPLTGGDAWDVSSDEVVASVLGGKENHGKFMEGLRRAADFIESLGDVAVIFRPWHENVGSWFWWGGKLCTPGQYRELYRLTWVYFVKERGLTNIVWCYSPNGDATAEEYMERYPGDEFVDILGFDTYEYVGSATLGEAGAAFANELKDNLMKLNALAVSHKKIQCLSETGLEGIPDTEWWTSVLYPAIREFPISYVLTWRNAHDKPGHFYGPWKGCEGEEDFRQFSEKDDIVFLKND